MSASLILIGLSGVGKTTVGKLLAKELNCGFVDTDELIVEAEQLSIEEIFAQKGENYFRKIESMVINSLEVSSCNVISLGGGAFQKEENRTILQQLGKIIYLYAPVDIVWNRLSGSKDRPLLNCENPKEKLQNLFEQRDENYKTADIIIDTTSLDAQEIVREILGIINE